MGYAHIMRAANRIALSISALAICALAAADGFAVHRTPKVGASVKYAEVVDFLANYRNGNIVATLVEKVTAIDSGGNFTVEQTQLEGGGLTFDKEKFDLPRRNPVLITYKPNGQVVKMQGDLVDATSYRMENLGAFLDPGKPVSVGDTWSAEIKGDKALGTKGVKLEYFVLGEETVSGIATLKIKANAKETEGEPSLIPSNEFTIWISKDDGSMVQIQEKWTNALFPGVSSPIPATIKITRMPS